MKSLVVAAAAALTAVLMLVATSTHSAQYSSREFERDMRAILTADQSLKPDDFALWPKVADVTRRLARGTSVKAANEALDRVFKNASSKKLYSRVWAVLPGSTIEGLTGHIYRAEYDIYGARTQYPKIRQDLLAVVSASPSDQFVEFAYYALGDFEKAISERPNSPIKDVLHHALGFKIFGTIVQDAYSAVIAHAPSNIRRLDKDTQDTDHTLIFLNKHAELYDDNSLSTSVPKFAERAALAQAHFEFVLRDRKAPLADDAAYMLGWLAYHQGQYEKALNFLAESMIVGNRDYKDWGSVRQAVRVFQKTSTDRQYSLLKTNAILANQAPLWYVAARSAYRNFDYGLATEIAQTALRRANVSPERLPVTTDSELIERAIEHGNPQLRKDWKDDLHVKETAYLLAAAREHQQYLAYVQSIGRESPDRAMAKAKGVIVKYSVMLDQPELTSGGRGPRIATHKDLRQAIHLIDATLASLPQDQKFGRLREWLHYRKVRISAVFAPRTVGEAVAAMENDVPSSKLLNNALAEQIYAEGYMLGDLAAAQKTFAKLTSKYPNGNAVDNAYTWMAISYRCAGRSKEAQAVNKDIIRLFPVTRHAVHAIERMADPSASQGCHFSEEID